MIDELFGEVISSYSRAQAIDDGVLVDVSQSSEAKECGFKFPIAMTRAVWDAYVEVPPKANGQDVKGRLWDVLFMLRYGIQRSNGGSIVFYTVYVQNDNRYKAKPIKLKSVCGPGDNGEPVITIMLPDED